MDSIIKRGGVKAYLLDLFFPSRCPFCNKFIEYDRLCCQECFAEAPWSDENVCPVCGKSFLSGCICNSGLYYDRCFTAVYYVDEGKTAVCNLKYHYDGTAAELLGRALRQRLKDAGVLDKADAAVCVPMTVRSQFERGYNQSELIARIIIKGTGIPLIKNALKRGNVYREQHLLSAEERRQAVKKQYTASEKVDLTGQTVLLVDDVITTGSTLNFCSCLIKEKLGAKEVICAAAATTL